MRKKYGKKIIFCILKVIEERSRIRSWIWIQIRIHQSEVWIRGSGSTPKCHGSPTLVKRVEYAHQLLLCVPALPLSSAVLTKVHVLFRPIAGHANLCPSSISTKPQELDILLSTVKHEMLHALGFSVSLFAFYRQDSQLSAALTGTGTFCLGETGTVMQFGSGSGSNIKCNAKGKNSKNQR